MKYAILFILTILLCINLTASGQGQQTVRHDASVTFGAGSFPFAISGRGPAPFALTAQYIWQQSRLLGMGMIVNYSPIRTGGWDEERVSHVDERNMPHYEYISHSGETVGEYFSLMPVIRFNWVNRRGFTFYSKAAIGVSYDTDNSSAEFAAQLSPLGITFGSNVYGMLETGVGRQGLLVFGIGYKFR